MMIDNDHNFTLLTQFFKNSYSTFIHVVQLFRKSEESKKSNIMEYKKIT